MDLSRIGVSDVFFKKMEKPMRTAFADMSALEKGAIANPDEKRMVGHYWLRNSALSPNANIQGEINSTLKRIKSFARKVHQGKIRGQGGKFTKMLVVGIGGSALGPQFVSGHVRSKTKLAEFHQDQCYRGNMLGFYLCRDCLERD